MSSQPLQTITASRYNQMQAKIAQVLGNGSGRFGYGQTVISNSLPARTVVQAIHMQNLRTDVIKARQHQTGAIVILPIISELNLILDTPIDSNPINADTGEYRQYETLIQTTEVDKDLAAPINLSEEYDRLLSTRTEPWGGQNLPQIIKHQFEVVFVSANARRHFFNTGGKIVFEAFFSAQSVLPANLAKFNAWANIVSGMGEVRFSSQGTSPTGAGTPSAIGNFELTETDQEIFVKSTGSIYSTYNDSTYRIKARGAQNSNVITFSVEFDDSADSSVYGVYGGSDEAVQGTVQSRISQIRATGPTVSVPSPVYRNLTSL